MIRITDRITLDASEIEESFVRASGPGGQNVNKLATAVQLRFDVARTPSLPGDVRARLIRLAGRRLTQDGVLVLVARGQRTQEANRREAIDRLVMLIRAAAVPPRPRRPTRATAASRERRLAAKARQSTRKSERGTVRWDE